jgi:hypothetical protein
MHLTTPWRCAPLVLGLAWAGAAAAQAPEEAAEEAPETTEEAGAEEATEPAGEEAAEPTEEGETPLGEALETLEETFAEPLALPHEPPPPPVLAPWSPIQAWYLAPSDRREGALRFRAALGGAGSSNVLHMSDDEHTLLAVLNDGLNVSRPVPEWPVNTVGGVATTLSLHAAWYGPILGRSTAFSMAYDGRYVPRAKGVSSNPFRIVVQRQMHRGQGDEVPELAEQGAVWASLALLLNPHEYTRPLPSVDQALHDPLPDKYVPGNRHTVGFEAASNGVVLPTWAIGGFYRLQRRTYPNGLDSWDASHHDLGLRTRWWPIGALYVEASGGFASSVARGDSPATTRREVDPSWAGTRWGLDIGWDTTSRDAVPWRVRLAGDLVQRNFRTGDATNLGHYGRRDVGGSATAQGSWAPKMSGPLEEVPLALSLAYVLNWNHTNLAENIAPVDEGDFFEHAGILTVHGRYDLDL